MSATMLPSKSKSGISEASNNKTTPPTPKASKLSRAGSARPGPDSPSTQKNPRPPVDRSPGPDDSRPTFERRSPKVASRIGTPPDKPSRTLKPSELQAQLTAAQDDLNKAKDQLAFAENEKIRALEELKDAKRLADNADEKVREAVVAQKRAEEALEIEKFQAVESEQANIEAAKKKEEEWRLKLQSIQKQHADDAAALQSIAQELERAKHELSTVDDAKNSALKHADEAMKIAEVNAESAQLLSAEVDHLKSLLDTEVNNRSKEATDLIRKLESEASELKTELEKAKASEEKLDKMEILVEELRIDVANAKKAEAEAGRLADQWKQKVELLETRLEELYESGKSKADSLLAAVHESEVTKALLQDKDSEIVVLKDSVSILDHELAQHKKDSSAYSRRLDAVQKEALELNTVIEDLDSRLRTAEEEKMEAVDNEKVAFSKIEGLSDEKDRLIKELEASKDEGEKVKKAMADLASALHEATGKARDAQEKFLAKQAEFEITRAQIEELDLALKSSRENYEVMLDEANYGRVCLEKTVERLEAEAKNSTDEWHMKELGFVDLIRKSEEEIMAIKLQMDGVVESLRERQHELQAAKEENAQLQGKLRQLEAESAEANRAAEEAQSESLALKERLLDRENELQNIMQENKDMRVQESSSFEKISMLSALLEEVTTKKDEVDGALLSNEKEVDLPKPICSPVKNADEDKGERPQPKVPKDKIGEGHEDIADPEEENGKKDADEAAAILVEAKMWESGKVEEHGLSKEKNNDTESAEEDREPSTDGGSIIDQKTLSSEKTNNRTTSPTKQHQQQKKKPLLKKFGSLLKKKTKN